jgi:hypothetical protein
VVVVQKKVEIKDGKEDDWATGGWLVRRSVADEEKIRSMRIKAQRSKPEQRDNNKD